MEHRPDVLSVLIGVNDVWRQYQGPERLGQAVCEQEYEQTYRRLLGEVKEKFDSQLVIIEPFMFCDNEDDEVFATLRRYISIVNAIAKDFGAVIVPLQGLIDEQIKTVAAGRWSADSVHPFVWAHSWIAQRWIEATKV